MEESSNKKQKTEDSNKKQETEDPDLVHFKIAEPEGKDCYFRVSRNTKLGRVFENYCSRHNLDAHATRFLYNGCRVPRKLSLADLNFKDGDEIIALTHVHGGGSASLAPVLDYSRMYSSSN